MAATGTTTAATTATTTTTSSGCVLRPASPSAFEWLKAPVNELHCLQLEGQSFSGGLTSCRLPTGAVLAAQAVTVAFAATCANDDEGGPSVTAVCCSSNEQCVRGGGGGRSGAETEAEM